MTKLEFRIIRNSKFIIRNSFYAILLSKVISYKSFYVHFRRHTHHRRDRGVPRQLRLPAGEFLGFLLARAPPPPRRLACGETSRKGRIIQRQKNGLSPFFCSVKLEIGLPLGNPISFKLPFP